jgi:hypothetical protein
MAQSLSSARPKATEVVFTAHFDSYLMQPQKSGLVATYHVSWVATTKFKVDTSGKLTIGDPKIKYNVEASGQVKALPADMRKVLAANYKETSPTSNDIVQLADILTGRTLFAISSRDVRTESPRDCRAAESPRQA